MRTTVLVSLAAAAFAPAVLAQPKVSSAVQKASVTDRISVAGLTLPQVLAKPDATKVVLKDGKETTVGEIRRGVAARDQHVASLKTSTPALAGKLAVRRPDGAARLGALAATLAAEDAAAKTAHTPRGARDVRRASALDLKNFQGILQVNGKTRGWHVTPGGYVTIDGQGFGDALSEVRIFGQFPGGPLALTPVDWRAEQIYAQLPLGARGVLDQDVQIQVVTAARKTFRLDGGHFVATRGPEFTVTSQLQRLIRNGGSADGFARFEAMNDQGRVYRVLGGHDIHCPASRGDWIHTLDPGRGFVVTGLGAHFGRTDTGDGDGYGRAGSRSFAPGYSFGSWNGDDIEIFWGVWRSHISPSFGGLVDGLDTCESSYQLEVSVQGPLGVPF